MTSQSIVLPLLATLAFVACSADSDPRNVPIEGNVTVHELAELTAVGFILVDGQYRFFSFPGEGETAITALDADRAVAYGWTRTTPEANDESFRLDLRTNTFTRLVVPGVDRTIIRGADGSGLVVGLANVRALMDTYGFVLDDSTGEITEIRRPGYTQGAVTDINDDGLMVGYSAFGEEGWVLRDGEFLPLEAEGAGRLFPLELTSDGRIVGLWGDPGSWWDPSRGFLATPSGDGWSIQSYRISPDVRSMLNGINEAGQLAGLYLPMGLEGRPVVFTLENIEATPRTILLPGNNLRPWVDGLDELGRVFGHVIIDHSPSDPEECGGHGHLHGTQCHCDPGYAQDPDDAGMCVAE